MVGAEEMKMELLKKTCYKLYTEDLAAAVTGAADSLDCLPGCLQRRN